MPQQTPKNVRSLLATGLLALSAGCTSADVLLTLSHDAGTNDLNVVYRFSEPVEVLSFETDAGPVRRYWTPMTNGVEMRGDTAASTRGPINEMRFAIRPDELQFDRVNPGVYVVGNGIIFNVGNLLPDSARFDHELLVDAPGATLVTDHVYTRLDAEPEAVTDRTGFAYVGPGAAVHRDRNVVVVAPEPITTPVIDLVSTMFSSAADYYAEFAAPPVLPPRIYLALDNVDEPGRSYRGTVLGNALAVYLSGKHWLQPDLDPDELRGRIAGFIRHETFHFYQGEHHSADDDQHSSAWLWEGSAEYFAARLATLQDGEGHPTLQELGMKCLMALLDEPLVSDGGGHMGDAPYACGHFLVATAAMLTKDPDRAIAAIWEGMLDPAGVHGSAWTTDEFFEVARAKGADAALDDIANLIIDTPGIERWDDVMATLRVVEPLIDISIPPDVMAESEALDLLFRLITSHCGGASGFWNHRESITLDAADCSGGLIDRAEVTGVESHPFDEPTSWLDAFKARCAAGDPIRFRLRDGSEMPVPCDPRRIQHP